MTASEPLHVYTSRVSNLRHPTPYGGYLRAARGSLPHDVATRAGT